MKKVLIILSLLAPVPMFAVQYPYQTPNYPTPNYPTPGYPTPNYATPNYATPNYATPSNTNVSVKISNPFKVGDDLYTVLKALVDNVVLPIGGVLCVLGFIYAGFRYVIARGDQKAIGDAHRTLLHVAIGTAVLLGSWMLATVVQNTVGSVLK